MKKKFLSLMMAAAVVATTSVSAFATTNPNVTNSDDVDGTANVKITGEVESDTGEKPAGRFEVTVPTTASFTVDQDGKFIASNTITIKNGGVQNIDVYANKFVDATKKDGDGITVVKKNGLESRKRTYVALNIEGDQGTVHLKTEDTNTGTKNGLYTDETLDVKADGEDLKLVTIPSGQTGDLTLHGEAGGLKKNTTEGVVGNAVSNNFTLTLKIKKSTTNQ